MVTIRRNGDDEALPSCDDLDSDSIGGVLSGDTPLILREIGVIRGQLKSGVAAVAQRISYLEQKLDGVGATGGLGLADDEPK